MSVLISGMEMPKADEWYEISIFPNGEVCRTNWQGDQTLIKGVTAVPVPPHGRLIDESWLKEAITTTLEALKKNPKMDRQEAHLIAAFDTLRVMVEDAPTIIPAEEGET